MPVNVENKNSASCTAEAPTNTDALTAPKTHHVAIAASCTSVITKFLLYPLDTLKSRVQNYTTAQGYSAMGCKPLCNARAEFLYATAHHSLDAHRLTSCGLRTVAHAKSGWCGFEGGGALVECKVSLWQGVRHQYAGKWGLRDLYGGFALKTALYVPYQMLYQSSYSVATTTMRTSEHRCERASFLCRVAASAVIAEFLSCLMRVPIETLKLRIQTKAASNATDAVRQLGKNGLRAFVRLILPQTLVHDIPYSVTQWMMYETLREWAMTLGGSSTTGTTSEASTGQVNLYQNQFMRVFLSGGLSGLTAATLTIPLDNIRTRVTVATARNPKLRMRTIVWAVYRADGIRSLFRGGAMRTLCVTANMAIYFSIFEFGKRLLAE